MRGSWKAVVALTLLLAGLPPAAAAAPTPPLSHEGRWITDADGRVVFLHGFNVVNKLPPYQPAAYGFDADDARFLRRHGFNTVRLGIIWKGLEPERDRIDGDYLRQTLHTARLLQREGIFVLLDFHQDMYNERFQGEGFPDWAVIDDGLPAQPRLGFPGNYLAQPALWRAFDHFWLNDDGVQDAFAGTWAKVADRFRGKRRILGYNLLNEPWPGSQHVTCLTPEGCPAFDVVLLTEFSKRIISAIRKVDRRTLVWYAPNLTFDFGARTWHGDTGDERAGFAFNNYCLGGDPLQGGESERRACGTSEGRVFDLADEHSAATGDALLMTEFGANDDLETIERMTAAADEHMVSWQQWAWWNRDPSSEPEDTADHGIVKDPAQPPAGDNVKWEKLDATARPFPHAVAGTPESFSFDPDAVRFELVYRRALPDGRRAGRRLATEVFVPRRLFGRRYRVQVERGRVVSRPGRRILRVVARRDARQVRVTVERSP